MKNTRFYAVIACLLAMPTWGIAAAPVSISSSSAYVDGLSYRLVDLDANDGVTPWITFTGYGAPLSSSLNITQREQVRPTGFDDRKLQLDGSLFSSSAGNLTSRDGLATASKQGNSLSATAGINHDAGDFSGFANQGLSAGSGSGSSWTLSPHTALVLEGAVSLSASINPDPFVGTGSPFLFDDLFIGASATLYLDLIMDNADGLVGPDPSRSVLDSLHLRADAGYYGGSGVAPTVVLSDSKQQPFSLTVRNTGDNARLGGLSLSVQAGGNLLTAPTATSVPEPSTAALSLIGLLGVITVAGRRRS